MEDCGFHRASSQLLMLKRAFFAPFDWRRNVMGIPTLLSIL